MHTVVVLALDGVLTFDLGTPLETFGRARLRDGRPAYRLVVCSAEPVVEAGSMGLHVERGLDALAEADTIMVPGRAEPMAALPEAVLEHLRAAAATGTRVASICTGAFTLAAAGLLDGQRATTHWAAADAFAAAFPRVHLDPSVLFVDNGQVLTSAGAAAGIDLCLHLIRRDHGAAVAADTARLAVVALEREGGQAQFIVTDHLRAQDTSLTPLLVWLEANAQRPLRLSDMARQAGLSTRTLSRRFLQETQLTPVQWLRRARIRQAQLLLETSDHSIDRITRQTGFGSATNFRDTFKGVVGTTPQAYRRNFSARDEGGTGARRTGARSRARP
jgi:transcriptional regulator GlxA family with amidase domain